MSPGQIKGLQRALNAAGFVGADGQPLAVDGDIGPNTEAAIQSALDAAGTVNAGSPSELIRAVQGSLNATGATDKNGQPLKVDGRFGPLTESALQKVAPNDPVNVNPGDLAMRQMPENDLSRPLDMSPPLVVPTLPYDALMGLSQEMTPEEINRAQAEQHGVNLNSPESRSSLVVPTVPYDILMGLSRTPEMTLEGANREQAQQLGVNLNTPMSQAPLPPSLGGRYAVPPSAWGAGSEVQANSLDRARIAQAGAPEPPLDLRYAAMARRTAMLQEEMKRREDAKRQNMVARRNPGALDYSPLR